MSNIIDLSNNEVYSGIIQPSTVLVSGFHRTVPTSYLSTIIPSTSQHNSVLHEQTISDSEQSGQTISAGGQTISAGGQTISASEQIASDSGQTISVNEQIISASEQNISANEQTISANKQKISTYGQTISASEQTVSADGPTISANEQTVTADGPTISANEQTISVNVNSISAIDANIKRQTRSVTVTTVTDKTSQINDPSGSVTVTTVTDKTSQTNDPSGSVTVKTEHVNEQPKDLTVASVNLQTTTNNQITLTASPLTTIQPSILPTVSESQLDIKSNTLVQSREGVTNKIVMKSANIFPQNNISPQFVREISEMTHYLGESDILFTSSKSQYDLYNDFTSLTTVNSQDLIHDEPNLGLISTTSYHGVSPLISGSSSHSGSGYSKSRINIDNGLTPKLEDYVSMTTIQNGVISLNSKMDYPNSIKSLTPNLSSHYPPSHPRVSLTDPPPSASQVKSDIVPSVTVRMSETQSVGITDIHPGTSVAPSSGFTNIPGNESSTQGATTLPINFTALYIAIPVCFIIILIAVGLSYVGYNKRKKKRWNSTNERRNLWLNPVSDVSIPINSVSTVSTENDNKITTNLLSKTPPNIRKDQADGLAIYRVLYQFEAQLDSQISLKPDEIVSVVEKAENGWFRGEVLGKSGWFPSSYVEEVEPPSIETLEKVEPDGSLKKKGTVTSFLLKKREKQRKRSRNKQIEENEALETEKDEGLVSEVINMNNIGGVSIDIDDLTQSSGKLYKAVFQYKVSCKGEISLNVGDMVVCYDRDRNGWMRGKNLNSHDVGWFPAVYVNEATEEERPTTPTPIPYDQLSSNKTRNSNTQALGIEHRAVYAYHSDKPEDLKFEAGDIIVVFETLDNGWWLGCRGDEVGWLPGSYVELLDKSDDSSSKASNSVKNFSIFDELEQMSVKSNRSSVNMLDDQIENLPSEKEHEKSSKIIKCESKSVLSPDFKPARKAPLPPSVKPQTASPKIALSKSDQRSLDSLTDNLSEKLKPELPVRFVKPKLVKVPKHSSKKLRHLAVQPQPIERPLPPRPQVSKGAGQSRYRKYKPKDNNQPNVINGQNGDSTPVSSTPVGHRKLPPKPPTRNLDVESIDTKVDDLDVSMNSTEGSLNNSVGPKILNRISAHLLDEVVDNSMTPKVGGKTKRLKKVSPPVLPPPLPTNQTVSNNGGVSTNDERKRLRSPNSESNEMKLEENDEDELRKDFDLTEIEIDFVTNGDMHIDMGKYLDFNQQDTTNQTDKKTDVFPSESENTQKIKGSDHDNMNTPKPNESIETLKVNTRTENANLNADTENRNETEHTKDKAMNANSVLESNQSKLLNELNKFVHNNSTDNIQNGSKLTIHESNGIEKDNISNSSENSNEVRKLQKPTVPPKPLSPKPHVSKIPFSQPQTNIFNPEEHLDLTTTKRTNLRIALRSFRALDEGELSFDEGSFIMDIDEESTRAGWCVGMLADGTTGLYPLSHVGTSRSELQTEL